jgi:hypothetical protein
MGQQILDEKGQVLGYFLTEAEYARMLSDLAAAEFARRAAEDAAQGIVRRWDGTNGKTTAEAIAHLERLGREGGAGR